MQRIAHISALHKQIQSPLLGRTRGGEENIIFAHGAIFVHDVHGEEISFAGVIALALREGFKNGWQPFGKLIRLKIEDAYFAVVALEYAGRGCLARLYRASEAVQAEEDIDIV